MYPLQSRHIISHFFIITGRAGKYRDNFSLFLQAGPDVPIRLRLGRNPLPSCEFHENFRQVSGWARISHVMFRHIHRRGHLQLNTQAATIFDLAFQAGHDITDMIKVIFNITGWARLSYSILTHW